MDQYYEEITVGEERSFGEYEVTEAEMIEFAEQYDPQPFHVDPEAAEETIFGGLIAGFAGCAGDRTAGGGAASQAGRRPR
jgi:acyl dehydratase